MARKQASIQQAIFFAVKSKQKQFKKQFKKQKLCKLSQLLLKKQEQERLRAC